MAFDLLHQFVTKLGYANKCLTSPLNDAPFSAFVYHQAIKDYNHDATMPYAGKVNLLWPADAEDKPYDLSEKCFPHNFKGVPFKHDPATHQLTDLLREPEINPDIRRERDRYCEQSCVKDAQGRPQGFAMYMLVPIYALMEARRQGYIRLAAKNELIDTLAAIESEQPPMVEFASGSSSPIIHDIRDCDAWSLALYQLIPHIFLPNSPYATLGQALIEYLLARVNRLDLYSLWANEEIIGDVMYTNERRSRWNYEDAVIRYRAKRTAWGKPHRLHCNPSHKKSTTILALTIPYREMALTPPYQGSDP